PEREGHGAPRPRLLPRRAPARARPRGRDVPIRGGRLAGHRPGQERGRRRIALPGRAHHRARTGRDGGAGRHGRERALRPRDLPPAAGRLPRSRPGVPPAGRPGPAARPGLLPGGPRVSAALSLPESVDRARRPLRDRLRRLLRTARLSLELLLGRRLLLFAVVDFLIVGAAVLAMLVGAGDEPEAVWSGVVLPPFLLLGLPALSGIVEVERRAGCLDLALTTPAAEGYFLRRVAAVCGVLCLQGWLLMGLDWLHETGKGFPLLTVLAQVAVLSLFLGAAALFWAVRLKSGGAVWLASMGTVLAFSRWFFR